jgi:hypothetical protein
MYQKLWSADIVEVRSFPLILGNSNVFILAARELLIKKGSSTFFISTYYNQTRP